MHYNLINDIFLQHCLADFRRKKNVKYFFCRFYLIIFKAFPADGIVTGVLGTALHALHLSQYVHLSQTDVLHHLQTHQHWHRPQEGDGLQEEDKPDDCWGDHEPHRHLR